MIISFLDILWFLFLHLEPTGGFYVRNLPRAEGESWFCCERELLVQEVVSNWFWCKVLRFCFLSEEERFNYMYYFFKCPSHFFLKSVTKAKPGFIIAIFWGCAITAEIREKIRWLHIYKFILCAIFILNISIKFIWLLKSVIVDFFLKTNTYTQLSNFKKNG